MLLRLAVKNQPRWCRFGTEWSPCDSARLASKGNSPRLYLPNYGIAPAQRASSARGAMARPLRGLKVLDLGNFLAGPVVSVHLGAMGAEVIKLERITGDDSRAIGPMAADGESSC